MQLEGQEMWEPVRILCCPVLFPFRPGIRHRPLSARRKGHGRSEQQFPADSPPLFPEHHAYFVWRTRCNLALNERLLPSDSLNMTLLAGSQRSFLRIVVTCPIISASIPILNCCVASRPPG